MQLGGQEPKRETVALKPGLSALSATPMEHQGGLRAVLRVSVAKHIQGDPATESRHGPDPVDGLLHLAVTPVATLDRI